MQKALAFASAFCCSLSKNRRFQRVKSAVQAYISGKLDKKRWKSEKVKQKGVIPTPICQFFQVHSSIFEPDPSSDAGQASVVCITHCVFLFRISKDSLYRFLAHCVELAASLRFPQLIHQIQVFLPDMCGVEFLPLLIRSAQAPAWTVFAILWCTAVRSPAVFVGCGVA